MQIEKAENRYGKNADFCQFVGHEHQKRYIQSLNDRHRRQDTKCVSTPLKTWQDAILPDEIAGKPKSRAILRVIFATATCVLAMLLLFRTTGLIFIFREVIVPIVTTKRSTAKNLIFVNILDNEGP